MFTFLLSFHITAVKLQLTTLISFYVQCPNPSLAYLAQQSHSNLFIVSMCVCVFLSWRLNGGMEWWALNYTFTFGITRMAELSALCTTCTVPPTPFLGTHFCQRLCKPRSYWMQTDGFCHLKISKNCTGNRIQYLLSISIRRSSSKCGDELSMYNSCPTYSVFAWIQLYCTYTCVSLKHRTCNFYAKPFCFLAIYCLKITLILKSIIVSNNKCSVGL